MVCYDGVGKGMYEPEDIAKITELLTKGDISGWFKSNDGGPYLQEFQRRFADFCDSKYAFAVSSGSASIYIALRALGVTTGDFVVVPSYTHVGSVAPIVLAGGQPIFVDVDSYGNLDAQDLVRVMDEAHPFTRRQTKAIIVIHQLGMPCNMDIIKSVCGEIPIIEDASHALGSEYFGRKAGTLGKIGCFSIGGGRTKTIGTGEGGMITTDDDELADKIKNIRNHGDRNFDKDYFCFNFRMSELNALIGLIQMDKLRMLINWQVENAEYMISHLPKFLNVLPAPHGVLSTRYIIGCTAQNNKARECILKQIRDGGFEGGVPRKNIGSGYSKLVSDSKFYSKWNRRCPFAEDLRDRSIWIDWHRYPRTHREIIGLLDFLNEVVVNAVPQSA